MRLGRQWLTGAEVRELHLLKLTDAEIAGAVDSPELRPLVEHCFRALSSSDISPSVAINGLAILKKTCADFSRLAAFASDRVVVEDELFLHRATSIFGRMTDRDEAVARYLQLAPLPDMAVVLTADAETILARVQERGATPNIYLGLGTDERRGVVQSTIDLVETVAAHLESSGVRVIRLDASAPRELAIEALVEILDVEAARVTPDSQLDRLVDVSASFRRGDGRHQLRHQGLAYCAFSVPGFEVPADQAQRNAPRRLAKFGVDETAVQGRSVLDLGSNSGAMLFQLSNFGPAKSLGVEYDAEKVYLAADIGSAAGLSNLDFRVGDIDKIDSSDVGVHDIVLALAIEAHVNDPEHLYRLLGEVTRETLLFEGNARCDMRRVRESLAAAGFTHFEERGFCDDDIEPDNNQRPLMIARKPSDLQHELAQVRRLRRDQKRAGASPVASVE